MKKIVAMFLLCAAATVATADVLWGKAKAGDSLADVQLAHPDGQVVEPTPGGQVRGGAVARYRLPSIEIEGDRFSATFFFLETRLAQVNLLTEKRAPRFDCMSSFDVLKTALRAKYGKEVQSDPIDPRSYSHSTTFVSGRTDVQLYVFSLDESCSINIAYSNRLATTADKL